MKSLKRFRDPVKAQNYRRNSKLKYYRKHCYGTGGKRWTPEEDIEVIYNNFFSDVQLAFILGRSVAAIQKRRWQIKKYAHQY
jgi:hypothetical protein